MIKLAKLLFFLCALPVSGLFSTAHAAVDCTPESISLESQADVTNFQTDHGPCDHVSGDLMLLSSQVSDLDGLSALESIGGDLLITGNSKLEDLQGLSGLMAVGGTLRITFNDRLPDLDGLEGITEIGHDLEISNNELLANLDGLAGLVSVGSNIFISFNDVLINIDGLSKLLKVEQVLSITQNPLLSDVDGLAALVYAGSLYVTSNLSLTDCGGLAQIVDSFDDAEPGPGPGADGVPDIESVVRVEKNGVGCKSIAQVFTNAPLAVLNAGLNDAWYSLDTDGQGFLIIVFPLRKEVFLAWFTFDTERPPQDVEAILGDPGHRWLTAQGAYEDNEATLDVYVTSGGVFDSEEPVPTSEYDGKIYLDFTTCNSGTVSYYFDSLDREGDIPIERIVWDNTLLCYELGKLAEESANEEPDA